MLNFQNLCLKVETIYRLGLRNVVDVVVYRLLIKFGIHPVQYLKRPISKGPFYQPVKTKTEPTLSKRDCWDTNFLYFSWYQQPISDQPPNWQSNPFNGKSIENVSQPWWKLSDFESGIGDIKTVWEASRFDWVLVFAQRANQGDHKFLDRLNIWLKNWCEQNSPFCGPNWKCGQEASIRVIHLVISALILNQDETPLPSLIELIKTHLERIAPTIRYAVAQDNNHGTSEATALFVGGSWLEKLGEPEGAKWAKIGRKWLENRAKRLIGAQGSFSQYSINYHRLMLDTICVAELWRKRLGLPKFSTIFYNRLKVATEWLRFIVEPSSGDAPNLGSNDGARLLPLSVSDYRDYRPTVQLSSVLFLGKQAYSDGNWNEVLYWLQVQLPKKIGSIPDTYIADDGGYAMLRKLNTAALLRYPRFKFRPSQNDSLHVDLWVGAENIFRDAGSYSYNKDDRWINYFSGTISHNTIQFDDRDQMPRLRRFLLGSWLKTNWLKPLSSNNSTLNFGAGYQDHLGASHRRQIELSCCNLRVEDQINGFSKKATLRWRLIPGNWILRKEKKSIEIKCDLPSSLTLTIQSDIPIKRSELTIGWESRYYLQKTELPVIELEVDKPGRLITEISWSS